MGLAHSAPVRLYYDPASTNCLRVLVYLEEAKIPYELVRIDLSKGEHKSEEFVRLNPRKRVPFLVHGDVRIGESVAIIEYLGRIHPIESLFPSKDHVSCALNCRMIAEFHQKLDRGNIMVPVVFQRATRQQIGEDRIREIRDELALWDEYVARENDYLLGNTIATADIIIFPNIATYFWLLGAPENDFPFLAAWYHRMRERPSVKKQEFWTTIVPRPEWRVLDHS